MLSASGSKPRSLRRCCTLPPETGRSGALAAASADAGPPSRSSSVRLRPTLQSPNCARSSPPRSWRRRRVAARTGPFTDARVPRASTRKDAGLTQHKPRASVGLRPGRSRANIGPFRVPPVQTPRERAHHVTARVVCGWLVVRCFRKLGAFAGLRFARPPSVLRAWSAIHGSYRVGESRVLKPDAPPAAGAVLRPRAEPVDDLHMRHTP